MDTPDSSALMKNIVRQLKAAQLSNPVTGVGLTIYFWDKVTAANFAQLMDTRVGNEALCTAIHTLLMRPPNQWRNREGQLQLQLPKGWRKKLKEAAAAQAFIKVNDFLVHKLDPLVDFSTGKPRILEVKKDSGRIARRFVRPENEAEFCARARVLAQQTRPERYTFNARNARHGLKRLFRKMDISPSDFFSAFIVRLFEQSAPPPVDGELK